MFLHVRRLFTEQKIVNLHIVGSVSTWAAVSILVSKPALNYSLLYIQPRVTTTVISLLPTTHLGVS